MFKLYRLKNYNFRLIIWLLMISGIGVLLVGSAKASLQSRQLIGVILGLVVMVVVSLMDYSWLLNFYWIIYGVNIIMLLIVRFFGDSAGGATRWLDLGFVRFQPTELSKILLIMFFARFLMDHEDTLNTCKTILASVVLLAVPLVLIKIQPDLKNTITVTIIFCLMMYVAGLSYKIIGGILGVAIPLVIVAFILITQTDIKIIDSYQKESCPGCTRKTRPTKMMLSSSKIQLQLLVPVNLPEKDIITTKFPLQIKEILLLRFRQTLSLRLQVKNLGSSEAFLSYYSCSSLWLNV